MAKRTDQQYVMIEGLCNSSKLQSEDDKMEMRLMDEFINVETHIGEVAAVIGLQFTLEAEYINQDEIKYEQGEDAEEAPPKEGEEAEEGEKKAPAYKVSDFEWSVTDRMPKNLPQIYLASKGVDKTRHEVK